MLHKVGEVLKKNGGSTGQEANDHAQTQHQLPVPDVPDQDPHSNHYLKRLLHLFSTRKGLLLEPYY